MSLDRAYRRLLLAYPRAWRDARGDEVLAVLLDGAEARGAARPSVTEALDLVVHGGLARAGLLTRTVDVRARELLALLAMASLTALSTLCLLLGEWWPWPIDEVAEMPLSAWPGTPGPFFTLGGPLVLALLAPTALVLAGRPRPARALLLGLVPVIALLPLAAHLLDVNRPALWTLGGLLVFSVLSLAAPVRQRAALAALSAGTATAAVLAVLGNTASGADPRGSFYHYAGGLENLLDAGPLAVAVLVAFAAGRRRLLPAALVGAGWLATFAGMDRSTAGTRPAALLAAAAALCLLAWSAERGAWVARRSTGLAPD